MTLPEADTYKLRLSVRHHSMEALSKLSTMSLWLDRPLKSSVPVPFFSDRHALAANDAFSGGLTLPRGATCSLLAAAPAADKLPKGLEPGDVLTGSATFVRKTEGGSADRPKGWPIHFVVQKAAAPAPAAPASAGSASAGSAEKDKGEPDEAAAQEQEVEAELKKLAEEARDVQIKGLSALSGSPGVVKDKAWDTLFSQLLAEWPDHLPLLQVKPSPCLPASLPSSLHHVLHHMPVRELHG